jgi:hypothetical protein
MTVAVIRSCSLIATDLDVSAIRTFMTRLAWRPFDHPTLVAMGEKFVVGQLSTEHMSPAEAQIWAALCLRVVGKRVGNPTSMSLSANLLRPGQEIARHRDPDHGDDTRRWPLRHHLVVDAEPGCSFTIGSETIEHRTGQLWRVDRTRVLHHWAKNASGRDRNVITFNVPDYEPGAADLMGVRS